MKKPLLGLLLGLCLALSVWILCPGPVSAEEETAPAQIPGGSCGSGLTWALSDGTLTVSGSGPMDDFPSGAPWADYRDSIQAVVLSGDVTTVGSQAFLDYDGIRYVDFGSSLVEIGAQAFMDCDGLTGFSLPESFHIFGEESFRDCVNLREIHCSGYFPSFRTSCLFHDSLTLYYPDGKNWPLEDIIWMESVFSMEFLREDGYDPYDPAATEPEPSTTPTEAPTTAPATVPATTPVTTPTTAPATTPTTVPAADPTTVPTTEAADIPTSPATNPPTAAPGAEDPGSKGSDSRIVGIIAGLTAILALAALALLLRFTARKRRGGRYARRRRN